jgi:hypothetical protein
MFTVPNRLDANGGQQIGLRAAESIELTTAA